MIAESLLEGFVQLAAKARNVFFPLAGEKLFRCGAFEALRCLGVNRLRRRVLAALLRRLIAFPEAQHKAS